MRFNHSTVTPGSASRLATGLAAVEAHRDGQVGVDGGDRGHRQRVQDAAVGEQAPVDFVRGDHARYRDGRPDRLVDGAALKPHRLARQQVGRHRGVGDGQFLDGDRAEDVAHRVQDLLGPQHAGRADRRVQQPQDGALRQRLRPVGELVEASGRLHTADQRAHRRAGDPDDLVAALAQRLDHPDVGVAAGTAAAERQRHPSRAMIRASGTTAPGPPGICSFCAAKPAVSGSGRQFCTPVIAIAAERPGRGTARYPHSSLAAARAATITAACRAGVRSAHRVFQRSCTCPTARPGPSPDTARTATHRSWAGHPSTLLRRDRPGSTLPRSNSRGRRPWSSRRRGRARWRPAARRRTAGCPPTVDAGRGFAADGACEHPVTANKPAATTTVPHRRERQRHQRTVSIYATLSAVMEHFGFCECCRPLTRRRLSYPFTVELPDVNTVSACSPPPRALRPRAAPLPSSGPTRLRVPDLLNATDQAADDVLSGRCDHLLPASGVPPDAALVHPHLRRRANWTSG